MEGGGEERGCIVLANIKIFLLAIECSCTVQSSRLHLLDLGKEILHPSS